LGVLFAISAPPAPFCLFPSCGLPPTRFFDFVRLRTCSWRGRHAFLLYVFLTSFGPPPVLHPWRRFLFRTALPVDLPRSQRGRQFSRSLFSLLISWFLSLRHGMFQNCRVPKSISFSQFLCRFFVESPTLPRFRDFF